MRRGPAAVLATIVAACAAGPAAAAPVQVAGPTPSGATLLASDSGRHVCTTVRLSADDALPRHCTAPPARTRNAIVEAQPSEPGHLFVSIVVPAGGASEAEVVGTDGVSTRIPIGPGSYTGRVRGRVAFGLAELPSTELRIVRFFDPSGRKIAVYQDPYFSFEAPPTASAPFTRGHGWRAVAQVREELHPTPLDAEHREQQLCVTLRFAGLSAPGAPNCAPTSHAPSFYAVPQFGTCATPAAVVVFTTDVVTHVKVTFGDGSQRTRRTRALPFATDGRRAAIVAAPRRLAIRSVSGLGPTGTRAGHASLWLEPAAAHCADDGSNSGGVELTYGADVTPPASVAPAEPELVVQQRGDELCLGIGGIQPLGDCLVPSAEDDLFEQVQRRYTDGSVTYAGIVDPRTASVTAIDARGRRVSVKSRPLPPDAGDYAAVARAFIVHMPSPAVVLRLRNAAGRLELERLTNDGIGGVPPFRVGATSGGVRLLIGRRRIGTHVANGPCVVPAPAHERPDLDFCATPFPDVGEISVPCSPRRRTIVYGRLPRRATGAHLVLASGASIAADVDRRSRAWIAVAPASAALRAVVVTGAAASRSRISLPPAAKQCGYASFFFSDRS